jgi:hypothetical protein
MYPPSQGTAMSLIALAIAATGWCLVNTPSWVSTPIVLTEAFGWCWWLDRHGGF